MGTIPIDTSQILVPDSDSEPNQDGTGPNITEGEDAQEQDARRDDGDADATPDTEQDLLPYNPKVYVPRGCYFPILTHFQVL